MLKRVLLTVFFILSLQHLACAGSNPEVEFKDLSAGPIPVKNQMPLYLIYLQMAPDRPGVTEKGKFDVSVDYMVSNITVSAFTPGSSLYDIDIDCEISKLSLNLTYGLTDRSELKIEVPYINMSAGYLDNFIEAIEDGIGATTPRSRERQGSYEFDYSFRYNGRYLIKEKHARDGLGDIVLELKSHILKESGPFLPDVSLRAAIKLPTGDKDELLGSGEFDYGAGLLLEKSMFKRLFLYGGVNIIFIKKPEFLDELDIGDNFISEVVSVEYFLSRKFSLIAQISGNTTPYPSSGTNVLDNDAHQIAIGLNYRHNDSFLFYFGAIENVESASSPDVTFDTGLSWEF